MVYADGRPLDGGFRAVWHEYHISRYAGNIGGLGAISDFHPITTAILSGVLTGEWKGSPVRARAYLGGGLMFLILATVLFTTGNSR